MRDQGPEALVDITRLQPGAYLVFVRPPTQLETEPTADQRSLEAQIRHAAFAVLDKSASPNDVLRVVQRIKGIITEKDRESGTLHAPPPA